jgi:hypothetical protein
MADLKRTKKTNNDYKMLERKLKIEQHEPHKIKPGVISDAPTG